MGHPRFGPTVELSYDDGRQVKTWTRFMLHKRRVSAEAYKVDSEAKALVGNTCYQSLWSQIQKLFAHMMANGFWFGRHSEMFEASSVRAHVGLADRQCHIYHSGYHLDGLACIVGRPRANRKTWMTLSWSHPRRKPMQQRAESQPKIWETSPSGACRC